MEVTTSVTPHIAMSTGTQSAVDQNGNVLNLQFPGGQIKSDGSWTNVDGASDTVNRSLIAGQSFTVSCDIAAANVNNLNGIVIGNATNGYAMLYNAASPSFTLFKFVSGGLSSVAGSGALPPPLSDTGYHAFRFSVTPGTPNLLECTIDGYEISGSDSDLTLTTGTWPVTLYTGGLTGFVQNYVAHSSRFNYQEMPSEIATVIDSSSRFLSSQFSGAYQISASDVNQPGAWTNVDGKTSKARYAPVNGGSIDISGSIKRGSTSLNAEIVLGDHNEGYALLLEPAGLTDNLSLVYYHSGIKTYLTGPIGLPDTTSWFRFYRLRILFGSASNMIVGGTDGTSLSVTDSAGPLAGVTNFTSHATPHVTLYTGGSGGFLYDYNVNSVVKNFPSTDDTSSSATHYPLFTTGQDGMFPHKTSASKLAYSPNTGTLSATRFVGALTGSATSLTTTDDTTTGTPCYPTFQTAVAGTNPLKTSSTKLAFQPSTGTLTAAAFSGNLLYNEFGPTGYVGSDGSLTNADGLSSATTYNLVSGSVFEVSADIAKGSTPSISGLILGNTTNGYAIIYDGSGLVKLGKWVSGVFTQLGTGITITNDTHYHSFSLGIIAGLTNYLFGSVDNNVMTWQADASINLSFGTGWAVMLKTGGNTGTVQHYEAGMTQLHYPIMPRSVKTSINYDGSINDCSPNLLPDADFGDGTGTGSSGNNAIDGTYSTGTAPKYWNPRSTGNGSSDRISVAFSKDDTSNPPVGHGWKIALAHGLPSGVSVGLNTGATAVDGFGPLQLKAGVPYVFSYYAQSDSSAANFTLGNLSGGTYAAKTGYATNYGDTAWHRYAFDIPALSADAAADLRIRISGQLGGAITRPTGMAAAVAAGGALTAGTYRYYVTAVNANGESGISGEVSATTTGTNLTVNLSWTAVAGTTTYNIYRTAAGGAAGTELLRASSATNSYSDTAVGSPAGTAPSFNTTGTAVNLWVCGPKLEEGSVLSTWSPSLYQEVPQNTGGVMGHTGTSLGLSAHVVVDSVTASGVSTTVTFTNGASFTSSTSYVPHIIDTTSWALVAPTAMTASSFTFASTSGHVYIYTCTGY